MLFSCGRMMHGIVVVIDAAVIGVVVDDDIVAVGGRL